MKVLFSPEVRTYFKDLEKILLEKGYFVFEESAIRYVRELIFEIRDKLPTSAKHPAPPYFDLYGKDMYYSSFRKNKATQWYAFFSMYKDENKETVYIVRFISNNHMIAHLL